MQTLSPRIPRPRGARKKSFSNQEFSDGRPPVTHGYVKSFDGTKLFYSIEGKGKPLIFCYGLVCSSLHWTYQIEHFQQSYKAIWFDYRGHQNSEIPKNLDSLTLENIASDLGVILDELNIEDAVFLGHSMGVNVVLEFYRQQPKRVVGMVLANGTAQRPLETLFRHNALQAGFRILKKLYEKSPELVSLLWKSQKGNPFARSLVSLGGFNPHLTPKEDIELYIDQVANTDPAILIHLIENYDAYDANAWLHTIQTPTLIISGEQDRLIPVEQQELMHQLIPNSQLEVIQHGSHCPQMDLPDLVNLKIENFLQKINYGLKSSPTKETANLPMG
jgi:pimeloyl-ACP methyl ester carboxylesterase